MPLKDWWIPVLCSHRRARNARVDYKTLNSFFGFCGNFFDVVRDFRDGDFVVVAIDHGFDFGFAFAAAIRAALGAGAVDVFVVCCFTAGFKMIVDHFVGDGVADADIHGSVKPFIL